MKSKLLSAWQRFKSAFPKKMLVLFGATALLVLGFSIAVNFTPIAQRVNAQKVFPRSPNLFELSGLNTTINYSTTSFIGSPQLTYQTLNLSRQFTGEEINTLDTNIGKLVTVLVEPDADTGKEVWLTLLLPTINLPSSLKNPIKTEAILTTERTPVRGGSPILEGQLETYKTLRLTGTASKVNF